MEDLQSGRRGRTQSEERDMDMVWVDRSVDGEGGGNGRNGQESKVRTLMKFLVRR